MKFQYRLIPILAAALILTGFPAYSDDKLETKLTLPAISQKSTATKKAPNINALAAVVMEASSGRVLYSKNATGRRSIASTTKIMTAIVALENGSLEDQVTVSSKAAGTGGSTIGIRTGQQYTLKELLYALLMNSANDAAVAIAEHTAGTVEAFAAMMNEKARSIGMADSSFVTPHGLDTDNQYSTAYDMAILTRYALKNPTFAKIVSTTDSSIPGHSLYNTNELLGACPGVDGVKTGYTGKAGRCLIVSSLRNGMRLITVVLGSPTRTARAMASKSLIDYAYENYHMNRLAAAGQKYAEVPAYRGTLKCVDLLVENNLELPLSEDEKETLEKREYVPAVLKAPFYAGTVAGHIEYVVDGEVLAQSALVISDSVSRMTYSDYFTVLLKSWCRMLREGIFTGTDAD